MPVVWCLVDEAINKLKFVVGLGNPGRQYAGTRHNVGFAVVDVLTRMWNAGRPREAFSGLLFDARVERAGATRRVAILEPMTYMNCSGRAVRAMTDFFKASPEDVLIVLDDMALPVGRLRARAEGSAGGHNGLSDILSVLGTSTVGRLRIGIGSPSDPARWKDFVLSGFGSGELPVIREAVESAAWAVEDWVFHGIQYVMDKYNRKEEQQKQ